MLSHLQRKLIYRPERGPVVWDRSILPEQWIESVVVEGHDQLPLHGWWVRSPSISKETERRIVLLFPGNAGHRGRRVRAMRQFLELGWDVLAVDYRGYAENPGAPSEEAIAADAHQIWSYSRSHLGYGAERIVLCGQSLGGGVAVRLAAELCELPHPPQSPAGVILRGTFSSLRDAGRHLYPWLPVSWLLREHYPSRERIRKIQCPILVIHGQRDRVIPFSQAEELFATIRESAAAEMGHRFVPIPEADHNDMLLVAAEQIYEAMRDFLGQVTTSRIERGPQHETA